MNEELIREIQELKKEKDAVILAHYYVDGSIQEIADYVGDSFALAKAAVEDPRKTIVFCGVTFMGQSASILNPDKTVLVPADDAVCPMALMVDPAEIREMREKYEDLAVVCYINSMAETKALVDVCVTSSNAVKIVRSLPQKNIYFIPDQNLGSYIAEQVPEKNIMLGYGFCHVHHYMDPEDVKALKKAHPKAKILAHPECNRSIIELADYVGSTKGIIRYSAESPDEETDPGKGQGLSEKRRPGLQGGRGNENEGTDSAEPHAGAGQRPGEEGELTWHRKRQVPMFSSSEPAWQVCTAH